MRAEEVRRPREYIGLLEFIVFADMRKRDVLLQVRDGYHSVAEAFAPWLIDSDWAAAPFPMNVVVCTRGGGGQWLPGYLGAAGHFIGGQPSSRALPMDGDTVQSHCMRNGMFPVMTVADGDCGLDVLVMLDGGMRTVAARSALRLEMCEHMRIRANDVRWQDLWIALQERLRAPAGAGRVLLRTAPRRCPLRYAIRRVTRTFRNLGVRWQRVVP